MFNSRVCYVGTQRTGPIIQSTTFPKGWSMGARCSAEGQCAMGILGKVASLNPHGCVLPLLKRREDGVRPLAPIKNCHVDSFLGLMFINHSPTEFHPTGLPQPCTDSRTSFSHSPFRPRRSLVLLRMESLNDRVEAEPDNIWLTGEPGGDQTYTWTSAALFLIQQLSLQVGLVGSYGVVQRWASRPHLRPGGSKSRIQVDLC